MVEDEVVVATEDGWQHAEARELDEFRQSESACAGMSVDSELMAISSCATTVHSLVVSHLLITHPRWMHCSCHAVLRQTEGINRSRIFTFSKDPWARIYSVWCIPSLTHPHPWLHS